MAITSNIESKRYHNMPKRLWHIATGISLPSKQICRPAASFKKKIFLICLCLKHKPFSRLFVQLVNLVSLFKYGRPFKKKLAQPRMKSGFQPYFPIQNHWSSQMRCFEALGTNSTSLFRNKSEICCVNKVVLRKSYLT